LKTKSHGYNVLRLRWSRYWVQLPCTFLAPTGGPSPSPVYSENKKTRTSWNHEIESQEVRPFDKSVFNEGHNQPPQHRKISQSSPPRTKAHITSNHPHSKAINESTEPLPSEVPLTPSFRHTQTNALWLDRRKWRKQGKEASKTPENFVKHGKGLRKEYSSFSISSTLSGRSSPVNQSRRFSTLVLSCFTNVSVLPAS